MRRSIMRVIRIMMAILVGLLLLYTVITHGWHWYKDSNSVSKLVNDLDMSTIKEATITINDSEGKELKKVPISSSWVTYNKEIIDDIDSTWDSFFLKRRFNIKGAINGESNSLAHIVYCLYCDTSDDKDLIYKACKRINKIFSNEELADIVYNRLYFGNQYFGFEDAAQGYFNKSVSDLTMEELNLLLDFGLKKDYEQYELTEDTLINGVTVLKQERTETVKFILENLDNFKNQSYERLVIRGVTINTTLEVSINKLIKDTLGGKYSDTSVLIVDNEYGKIVGSYGDVYTRQKPGLVIKPNLVWLPALCGQYALSNKVTDEKTSDCVANRGKYRGVISFPDAVAYSSNVVAGNIFSQIGSEKCYSYLEKMGFSSYDELSKSKYASVGEISPGTSIMDLANMYFTIFNGGIYSSLNCIDSLGTPVKSDGIVVYEYEATQEMTYCLEQTVEKGICKRYRLKRDMPSACYYDSKTGLYCGFSPYYTIVVKSSKDAGSIFKELQDSLCDGKAAISLSESIISSLLERKDYSDLIDQIDAIFKLKNQSTDTITGDSVIDEIADSDTTENDDTEIVVKNRNQANFGRGNGGTFNGESSDNNSIEFFK